jgi:hypothetical protein
MDSGKIESVKIAYSKLSKLYCDIVDLLNGTDYNSIEECIIYNSLKDFRSARKNLRKLFQKGEECYFEDDEE